MQTLSLLFLAFSVITISNTNSNTSNSQTHRVTGTPDSNYQSTHKQIPNQATAQNTGTVQSTTDTQNTSSSTSAAQSSTSSQSSSSSSLNIKQLMTQSEQKQAGLNKLTSSQVQALSSWMQNYMEQQKQQASEVGSNQVAAVINEGQYVKLGSGQVWTINPSAWIYTYYWKKGDPITVGKSTDTLFPVALTNQDSGQTVGAQQPSSAVQKSFSQTYQIKKIVNDGQFIELSNGSTWQIEPSLRYMTSGWSVGSPIFIVQLTQATGKPYALFNGETSRTVYANPIKQAAASSSSAQSKAQSSQNQSPLLPYSSASQNSSQ